MHRLMRRIPWIVLVLLLVGFSTSCAAREITSAGNSLTLTPSQVLNQGEPATVTHTFLPTVPISGSVVLPTSSPLPPSPTIPLPSPSPQFPTPTAQPPTSTTTISLTIRGYVLQVELASTPEQRSRGLMFREDLPEDGGMLFIFPSDRVVSFWMKNTPLPLSIAFIDAEKRIVNIDDMQPYDETSHPSAGPIRYALEVHQGWFARHGIVAGDSVTFYLPDNLEIR